MSTIKTVSGEDCRNLILKAIDLIHGPVASTLGPMGKTVAIGRFDLRDKIVYPSITKDGASVAKKIQPQENEVATIVNTVKQAALLTELIAGDGTTSSIILTKALYEAAMQEVKAGANPHEIKRQMDESVEKICQYLKEKSIPVVGDMLRHVATVSANGDAEVGRIVAEAYEGIGESGVVLAEKSKASRTYIENTQGMQFKSQTSPMFFNDPSGFRSVLDNPIVVVTTEDISRQGEVRKLVEFSEKEGRPIYLICDNIRGEGLNYLIMNKAKIPPFCVTTLEMSHEKELILEDIAIVTGATVMSPSGRKLEKASPDSYGRAERIVSYTERTGIIGASGLSDKIELRAEHLKGQIESPDMEEVEKESIRRRLASLTGGVSKIFVGAQTTVEEGELYDRYDDAIRAVACARKEGIVAGGGLAFIDALSVTEGFMDLVLWTQFITLQTNSGDTGSRELDAANNIGVNFKTKEVCNLIEAGIIEPVTVPITALRNAASVAGVLITTDNIIVYV